MKHNGWRKPTPGLVKAEELAQVGERLSIPKNQAMLAVKRVAPHLGLRAGELLLLDTLVAFTKPADWEQGSRPIVWPSNEYLMEQTGYSRAGIKKCLRRLGEIGLIAFKDSSNGKRWGHRNSSGKIIEAYGFDLAPLAARVGEFEMLHARLQEERTLCKSLKRKITIARRSIRSMLENALNGTPKTPNTLWNDHEVSMDANEWNSLWERFEALLNALPGRKVASERLMDLYDGFKALKEKVERAFKAATQAERSDLELKSLEPSIIVETSQKVQNSNPTGLQNEPHILITKQHHPVNSNINEKRKKEPADIELQIKKEGDETSSFSRSGVGMQVEIATIMSSCPSFAEMAHGVHDYIHDWREFVSVADKIRPMVEISPDAWQKAQTSLGSIGAAAAIALITDKYSDGEVSSPGGYLRGLIAKSEAGELHLARSFYGRLNEKVTA